MLEITTASYMILLIGIMIISGALGGMASSVFKEGDDQPFLSVILKHTFVGIITAMTVPLFLNLCSSDLLDAAQIKPLKLFILSGLCIFFALFSTRFLERIHSRRLKGTGQNEREDHPAGDQSNRENERTDPAVPRQNPEKKKIENQLKILRVLANEKDVHRTLKDLARDAEMSQKDFEETLSLLMAKGLVAQELSGADEIRFVATVRGQQKLNKI
jgi:hypothetical protein